MLGVTCQNAGNASEIKTGIHVGILPDMIDKRVEVSQQYGKLNEELDDIVLGMAKILRVRQQTGELSEQLQAHLEVLKDKKDEVYKNCMEMKKEVDKLETLVSQAREAKIRISGNIFKGTVIGVDDSQLPIQKDTSFMEYGSQNGIIVGTVIVI